MVMLEGLTPPVKINPCMIRTVLGQLDETDQIILKQALADQEAWSHRALAAALQARGLPLGDKILRQRRNEPCNNCTCRVV
jgi:hypothetical protein